MLCAPFFFGWENKTIAFSDAARIVDRDRGKKNEPEKHKSEISFNGICWLNVCLSLDASPFVDTPNVRFLPVSFFPFHDVR